MYSNLLCRHLSYELTNLRSIFLIALCLLAIPYLSYSQLPDSLSNSSLPKDKTALNSLIVAQTRILTEKQGRLRSLNSYLTNLRDNRMRADQVRPESLIKYFDALRDAVKTNDAATLYAQEGYLLISIQGLNYYPPPQFRGDQALDNYENDEFLSKISTAISPIRANPAIESLINFHYNQPDKPVITAAAVADLEPIMNIEALQSIKRNLVSVLDSEIGSVKKQIDGLKRDIDNLNDKLARYQEKLNIQETQINDLAIKLGLPLFCLTILALFIGPSLIKNSSVGSDRAVSQNVLLEISTVLLLTMSILILGLSDKINGDVLGTLIGGISGYVLNRMRNKTDDNTSDNSPQPETGNSLP